MNFKIAIFILAVILLLSTVSAYWGCANCYYNPSLQNYRYGHAPFITHMMPSYVTGYQPFIVQRYSYSPVAFIPTKYNGMYRSLPYPYGGSFFYR